MPCYYTGSAEGDANLEAEEARNALTKVTRLLCALCESVERGDPRVPKDVGEWWRDHKQVDTARMTKEAAKVAAEAHEKEKRRLALQAKKEEGERVSCEILRKRRGRNI